MLPRSEDILLVVARAAGTLAGVAPVVLIVVAALAAGALLNAVFGPVTLSLGGLRCAGC